MANYNANAMAAYQQYGRTMTAGGGGSNMSGTGSSTMQVFNAMRDDDDKPSGLAAKPTTTKDKKPSFWDRITSVFQENEVDVTNVYKPSVDPSNVYTQKMFEMVPSASDYVYRAEMSDKTQAMVEQAMGYEVPKLGQLQMIDEGPMSAEEQKQFGPLMKMADDIRNPNITTEELPDIELDQDAAVTDALMQGQPTGLMSRPSSFTGDGVQVASIDMGNMTPQQLEDYYAGVASGAVDPETGQTIQSAEDTGPTDITVRDNVKVFGYKGRNGPTEKQATAFNALRDAAIAKGIVGAELRQLLGQAAVESQWYTKSVEGGGGSASNISGGKKYLGRGPLQLTHDYNYKAFGEAKGVGDLYVREPERLADPKLGSEAALWFWETNVKPNVTDFTNTYAVSGLINRGSAKKKALHLDERKQAFQAIRLRDVSPTPVLRP